MKLWAVICCLLIAGCNRAPEGFEYLDEGISRKLLGFGDETTPVRKSTFVEIAVSASRASVGDIDFWTLSEFFPADRPWSKGSFEDRFIGDLVAGDSVLFEVPYGEFKNSIFNEYEVDGYTLHDTSAIRLQVSVRYAMDESTYFSSKLKEVRERRTAERSYLMGEFERRGLTGKLREYLGTWQNELEEGTGDSVRSGMDLVLSFKAYFFNDSLFDSALDTSAYIYFQYGKPDQVIRGLEIAVSDMRIGGRKQVFLTSDLAFGERGSGKGIVPPNTPVWFDLTLIDLPDSLKKSPKNGMDS